MQHNGRSTYAADNGCTLQADNHMTSRNVRPSSQKGTPSGDGKIGQTSQKLSESQTEDMFVSESSFAGSFSTHTQTFSLSSLAHKPTERTQ